MTKTTVLGVSALYHDSAACVLQDGAVIAAAQEERFTRQKHDRSFPVNAIRYCLEEAGTNAHDLDAVTFYEQPIKKFGRLLRTYLQFAPRGLGSFVEAMLVWLEWKLWMRRLIRHELGGGPQPLFVEHHESHAASAFFPSPFEEAAILTVDGVGEAATATIGVGRGNRIEPVAELVFPHSLGLLFSAFTYHTGFRVNSGEYKLMGLAPFGKPRYADRILAELIDLKDDGSFHLNMRYFDYCTGRAMTNRRFSQLFDGPPRKPETEIKQREMDLARSIQYVTEEVLLRMARTAHRRTGMRRLVMAGGVALNSVANGRMLREGPFDDIWVQPAAGDAGGALGAAMFAWYQMLGNQRRMVEGEDSQRGSYLGPEFSEEEIRASLDESGLVYRRVAESDLVAAAAEAVDGGKVVGWFQGRMEYGPRALGSRSILGDARSPDMQERMNLKIKFRESFRPFAPAVLEERAADYFEIDRPSPYMLFVVPVKPEQRRGAVCDDGSSGLEKVKQVRSTIPAVTHVDYSARVQTVDDRNNHLFHALLTRMEQEYGCPVLINTSFNVRGEPIVCSPADAIACFLRTAMDVLVIGPFVVQRESQPSLPEPAAPPGPLEFD